MQPILDRLQLFLPLYVAPKLCAASSMTVMPCLSAMALTSSMSPHCPYSETGMMALVRGVILASISETLILQVSGSTSTNTGTAPSSTMTSAVATNVNEVVMTSSPAFTPSAISAISSASVPEATVMQCLAPV
ncbi:hypothetical protein D3C85_1257780 [compost metagenome]